MSLETNFNVAPYFDDYDENKNYYRILFRPAVAVQARELNQMQTILQKQIDRFGQHIFREGTIVLGGSFDLELNVENIRALSFSPANEDPSRFVGKTFTGLISGVTGYCRAYEYDTDAALHVFFIRYTSGSETNTRFIEGEQVIATDSSGLSFTVNSASAAGVGSTFSITQGVIFSRGFFLAFPTQTVVLDNNSSTPSCTVGMRVTERLITELNDPTLFDNAQNYFNENAPGAHRLLVDLRLEVKDYEYANDDTGFLPLLKIKNGVTEIRQERTLYSRIYDELTKRTFDESGDYFVRGLGIRTREHLDTGTNEGVFAANNGGDPNKLCLDVDPGLAYVKGYEVNKLITTHVELDKSTEFSFINSQRIAARSGGFFTIKEAVGTIPRDEGTLVNLYDTAGTRITSKTLSTDAPSGNVLGTARVKHVAYGSGTLGTAAAEMLFYFYDLNMTSGVFADVRGVGISGTFFADVVLDGGVAKFEQENENILLFPIGSSFTRTIRDSTGSPDTIFEFYRTESKTADFSLGGGQFTVSVTVGNEEVAFGDGSLSDAEKRLLFVTADANTDIRVPGTVSGTSGASTLTGVSTVFDNLTVGNKIKVDGNLYYINSISGNTSLTVVGTLATSPSANQIFRSYTNGDYIDLTAEGSSGVERTASVSAGVLTVDLKEDTTFTPSNVLCKVSYPVERTSSSEVNKLLRPNRFVRIFTGNNAASNTGPYILGVPDVYKVRSVRLHSSDFSTGSEGSNVTSSFVLDTGQKDNHYEHSTIVHIGSLDLNSKYLLVELDHFEADFSSGFGYFSVDSYPINDSAAANSTIFTYQLPIYKSSTGTNFLLRDCFDFRPYKSATANSSTTIAGSTLNPATSSTFQAGDSNGLRIVTPDTNITADYSYYLGRRDAVGLSTEGEFVVIKGAPSAFPITPTVPDNLMPFARVDIAPYPSVTETLARIDNITQSVCSSEMVANIRYTMRDIGVVDQRVKNLEYYNTLNLLEKSAADLLILDDNGLDRFKNGFFVDGFVDHSLGATYDRDYRIAVDKSERVIRPIFEMDSFKFQLANGATTVSQSGSLLGKNYSELVLINQPRATTIRNIEQGVFRFIGALELAPDNDNWIDTTTVDKSFEFGNDIPPSTTMTTEWGSWASYVVGAPTTTSTTVGGEITYNVYSRIAGDRDETINTSDTLIGTFKSYADALSASNSGRVRTKIEVVRSGGTTTTTTTENTVSTRTGTVTTTTLKSQTESRSIGSFVTDVSLATYIRPQTIHVRARGLKARTRVYVFFDGENMSEYITPLAVATVTDETRRQATTPLAPLTILVDAEGDPLTTDQTGEVNFILRLPDSGKRFRVGTKEIIVTDSPTNAVDATTYAKNYFVSNGLAVNKQNTIISTKTVVADSSTQTINESTVTPGATTSFVTNNPSERQRVEIFGPSCLAYSFLVDVPRDQPGIFLTSVDVFIAAVHPTLGVWFEIREMNNAGGITRTQVPYSEVWYTSAQIQPFLSPNRPDTPFKVTFPSPVFLQNNTQYAFVIHTEGLNPDTYFWVSRLGETDVTTGRQVTGRQLTGTLFTTNNNLNYDIVPDVDLTVKFNRADYVVQANTVTQVILGNLPTEFIVANSASNTFVNFGETIEGSNKISLANVAGSNTIAVGDFITGGNSSVNAEVIAISAPFYFTTGIGYANGEVITVYASNGSNKSINAIISSVEGGLGVLRRYSTNTNLVILDSTNGKFFANALIRGAQSNTTARIQSFESFKFSTLNFKPHSLTLANTSITYEQRGYNSNTSAYSEFLSVTPDNTDIRDEEYTVLSRVNEIALLGGNSSIQIRATIVNNTTFISPVIDFSRCNAIFVKNILNNDASGEANTSGGSLINRYLSKIVTLADGQDAEDMLIKLSSYRPNNSDVKVWVKIRHDEDPQPIAQKSWMPMNYNQAFFSSSVNKLDFIEFDYTFPSTMMSNGIVTYTSGGVTFEGYKQFQIKVGLMGTDPSNPPRVTDLRAIALQK
jgi:hypothetical protein